MREQETINAPLIGISWDEEDGVPDGFVHLTYRILDEGRAFGALDRADITLLPHNRQGKEPA